MYHYASGTMAPGFLASRRARWDPGDLGDAVVANDWRTNRPCKAEERRIHPIVEPSAGNLVEVNRRHLTHRSASRQLRRDAYAAYTRMKSSAEADGLPSGLLTITSGYRSVERQRRLWQSALQRYGSPQAARRWVAPPGGSPHHTGRAVDLWLGVSNDSRNAPALRATAAYRWLVCNAGRFGFTPYAAEPWHWEYTPPGGQRVEARPSPRPSAPPSGAVQPARADAAGTGAMPRGPFGILRLAAAGRPALSYPFTPEDALWTARFILGEAGGKDNPENRAVIWTMFNRYALFTRRVFPTFHEFIRAYSTTLQPVLRSWGAARRHMHKPEFHKTGGFYPPPHQDVPKGQLRRHLAIQRMPWDRLPLGARRLAEMALRGQIANPIGNATEFGSTYVYFRDRHRRDPSPAEWRQFTTAYASGKRWRWIGELPGLDQRGNAFFVDGRVANLPAGAVKVTAM